MYICMYVVPIFENLLMGELSMCTISHLFIWNMYVSLYVYGCVFNCAPLLRVSVYACAYICICNTYLYIYLAFEYRFALLWLHLACISYVIRCFPGKITSNDANARNFWNLICDNNNKWRWMNEFCCFTQ